MQAATENYPVSKKVKVPQAPRAKWCRRQAE